MAIIILASVFVGIVIGVIALLCWFANGWGKHR